MRVFCSDCGDDKEDETIKDVTFQVTYPPGKHPDRFLFCIEDEPVFMTHQDNPGIEEIAKEIQKAIQKNGFAEVSISIRI